MNKRSLIAIGITASLLALSLAVAAEGPGRGEHGAEAFARADSNHDGRLSQAEFERARTERLAEQFRKMDANHDGGLTQDEMRQSLRQHREMRSARRHEMMAMREKLRALDANNDHELSRAEIGDKAPRLAEHFNDFDLNRDGKLSRDEIRAGHQALRSAR